MHFKVEFSGCGQPLQEDHIVEGVSAGVNDAFSDIGINDLYTGDGLNDAPVDELDSTSDVNPDPNQICSVEVMQALYENFEIVRIAILTAIREIYKFDFSEVTYFDSTYYNGSCRFPLNPEDTYRYCDINDFGLQSLDGNPSIIRKDSPYQVFALDCTRKSANLFYIKDANETRCTYPVDQMAAKCEQAESALFVMQEQINNLR